MLNAQDLASSADEIDPELTRKIQQRIESFDGRVGIYVRHLKKGNTVAINAGELFPTASMIKVPIMAKIFDKVEKSEFSYDQTFKYDGQHDYVHEVDLINTSKTGTEVPLKKLLLLMTSFSDNTASLWLQHLAGGGSTINEWLETNGYAKLRVNSRTEGREESFKMYGWGQTTPREICRLMLEIYRGQVVSEAASEEMYRLLSKSFFYGEALSQVPPTVNVASKQGAVSDSRSEVLLVNAPSGDYLFCLITDGQIDKSWEYDNAGFVLLRDVSRIIWKYFEPKSDWEAKSDKPKYW